MALLRIYRALLSGAITYLSSLRHGAGESSGFRMCVTSSTSFAPV